VSVFETDGAGLCRRYREHFDRGAALFETGIPPAWVAALIARRPTVAMTVRNPAMLGP
jgi:hypothetical protein